MIKRFVIITLVVSLGYVAFVSFKLYVGSTRTNLTVEKSAEGDTAHKVYSFSFSKYATNGKKELEIEGDTGNILAKTVSLNNVIAKAYADQTPVTITADEGMFDKGSNTVYLQNNVVATTKEGARLVSDALNIHPTAKSMDTDRKVNVKKDNIDVDGIGAHGDSQLKQVQFKKSVTVVIQSEDPKNSIPTVITCDGPLDIDYDQNIAHFHENVVVTDNRGKLKGDKMTVFYDKITKKVAKIHARGNVVITNPEGNATYSDEVTYLAKEGRILMGGSAEATYIPGTNAKVDDSLM